MNWYIGQDIVAVRDHSDGKFKRGDEFKIKGLQLPQCKCKEVEIDVGHTHNLNGEKYDFICVDCNTVYPIGSFIQWYGESCFAPLDPIKEAISELTEQTQVTPAPIPHAVEI